MLSRKLGLFILALFTVLTLIFAWIANFNYQKATKNYQAIKQDGRMITAYSIKDNCNKGRGLQPTRLYQYTVNQHHYVIDTLPENEVTICNKDTLGDTITVYYLPSNPYIKLSKKQLQQGSPSKTNYYITSLIFLGLFLAYWLGTKFYSNKEL